MCMLPGFCGRLSLVNLFSETQITKARKGNFLDPVNRRAITVGD